MANYTYFDPVAAYWKENKHKHPDIDYKTYIAVTKKYFLKAAEHLAEGEIYPLTSKEKKVRLIKYKNDISERISWTETWKRVQARTGLSGHEGKMIGEDIVRRTKYAALGYNFKPKLLKTVKTDYFRYWNMTLSPKTAYIHCCEYFKANPSAMTKVLTYHNVNGLTPLKKG